VQGIVNNVAITITRSIKYLKLYLSNIFVNIYVCFVLNVKA